MTSKITKCPYCRRRYQQAAAYEKHLQTMHLDIVLSLSAIAGAASIGPTFVRDELENLTDSTTNLIAGTRSQISIQQVVR